MRNTLAEFVTTGVATLPAFMLITTGSVEVFAVTVLAMTGLLVTVAAARPLQSPGEGKDGDNNNSDENK
jgi:hypothetical protein